LAYSRVEHAFNSLLKNSGLCLARVVRRFSAAFKPFVSHPKPASAGGTRPCFDFFGSLFQVMSDYCKKGSSLGRSPHSLLSLDYCDLWVVVWCTPGVLETGFPFLSSSVPSVMFIMNGLGV